MAEALVLNATYEPLCVVSQRRALILVLTDKAVMVEAGGQVLHSAASSVEVPVVVRLARFVRVPYRSQVPLTRKGVLARDHHRCVYCGAPATSLDHVIPRSRGGPHVWENVVGGGGPGRGHADRCDSDRCRGGRHGRRSRNRRARRAAPGAPSGRGVVGRPAGRGAFWGWLAERCQEASRAVAAWHVPGDGVVRPQGDRRPAGKHLTARQVLARAGRHGARHGVHGDSRRQSR
ncbi:HNH endonuclease [Frankia sp. AgW1.1]|uniref:HNH endonuclease n=1 Tax=Frankia sp. AgW1.1 TaxID=1836971 RepID=UPI0035ABA906